jgi:hypothetical protein
MADGSSGGTIKAARPLSSETQMRPEAGSQGAAAHWQDESQGETTSAPEAASLQPTALKEQAKPLPSPPPAPAP